jgi:hypothetical protein
MFILRGLTRFHSHTTASTRPNDAAALSVGALAIGLLGNDADAAFNASKVLEVPLVMGARMTVLEAAGAA